MSSPRRRWIRPCEGTKRRNGGGTWFPEHLRTPHSFIRTMPQETGKTFVPSLTRLLKNQAKNDVNMCGQKKNEKKAREEVEDFPKGTRKAPPTWFPPTVKVEMCEYNLRVPPQRKKALAVGQACCGKVGSGIICLRRMENNSVDSDADQKRRRKHDKGKRAKRTHVILANMIPSAPPSPPAYLDMIKEVRRPFTTSCTQIGESWDRTKWFKHSK